MSSKENYPIGYNSAVVQHFLRRCVQKNATFLIPHLKKENTLLDCGCGPGSITLDLASLLSQGKVVGIDKESSQIERAKSLAKKRRIQNAEFQRADLLNLPFKNDTFDIAFTHAVLWTLSDFFAAIEELKRVVKPGGIIACREPYVEGLVYYPESDLLTKAFDLQFRSNREFGCDNNLGKKLSSYFTQAQLTNIQTSVSCNVYSSEEEREGRVQSSTESWRVSPWAKKIRDKKWASEEEIQEFQQALHVWKEQPGAFMSTTWCEVIGYVS